MKDKITLKPTVRRNDKDRLTVDYYNSGINVFEISIVKPNKVIYITNYRPLTLVRQNVITNRLTKLVIKYEVQDIEKYQIVYLNAYG